MYNFFYNYLYINFYKKKSNNNKIKYKGTHKLILNFEVKKLIYFFFIKI